MPVLGCEPPVRSAKLTTSTCRTADGSHSTAYSLNVSNLRDTGHPAKATPPAAKADFETVSTPQPQPNFHF